MKINDIAKEACVVSDTATLGDVLKRMLTQHTNTVLVIDDSGCLVGEASVSDLFDGIIPQNLNGDQIMQHMQDEGAFIGAAKDAEDVPVSEFMTTDFDTVTPDGNILEVAAAALAGRARIAIVDHENRPLGIISRQGLKQILAKYLDYA